ncbi:hypothetical protein WJR50_22055 [Catalinimonas sp. 4WD22]|uniref:hypothetical protein n=1 Tax=Catalinimonas locisalis TaxID=3133978 RepID=UPI003100D0D7
MKTTSIHGLFEAVHLAIYNTQAYEDMQKRLVIFGYTPKRMQEGNALLEYARMHYSTQESHYNTARYLTLQISKDCAAALEAFREHVAIAKTAFRKAPYIIQELKVTKVATSKWKWVLQAKDFYAKAELHMEKLEQFGVSAALFQQNKEAIGALLALKAERLKKKGDAENSTEERDRAIKALRAWYGDFRKIARIAFKDTPQALETYGIKVSSVKKKPGKPVTSNDVSAG